MAVMKTAPGDIIGIPAENDRGWGFVLCRVIRKDVVTWIEVFSDFHTDFSLPEEKILDSDFSIENRLFNPVYASFDFSRHFGTVKWPILARTPQYKPEMSKISEIEFEGTSYDETGYYIKGGKEYKEKNGVRRNLEARTIYSNPQLIHHINLYLCGNLEKGQVWNTKLEKFFIEKNGIDWWINGIKHCKSQADIIAMKLIDARRSK